MNPRVELYQICLDILAVAQTWVIRAEGRLFQWKIGLIRRVHGEQSGYGW